MSCPVCSSGASTCGCVLTTPDGVPLTGIGTTAAPYVIPTTRIVGAGGVTVAAQTSGLGLLDTAYLVSAPAFDTAGESAVTLVAGTFGSAVGPFTTYAAPTPNRRAGQVQVTPTTSGFLASLVVIGFVTPLTAVPRCILVSAMNSAGAACQLYVSQANASGFTVGGSTAQASTLTAFSYLVIS